MYLSPLEYFQKKWIHFFGAKIQHFKELQYVDQHEPIHMLLCCILKTQAYAYSGFKVAVAAAECNTCSRLNHYFFYFTTIA
jgi:hypothetical protein